MGTIILDLAQRQALAKRSEVTYPLECSGLLLGHRNGVAKHVVDILFSEEPSQPESAEQGLQIPNHEMQAGEETAKARGLEVVGVFQSKVDRPARPSFHDRQSGQPTMTYLFVGVQNGRAHELTAWTLSEDRNSFFQEDFRTAPKDTLSEP